MSNIITEGQSLLGPPYFDGKNFTEWKELMRIFVRHVDLDLWVVIKDGRKIPTKQMENEEVEKSEDEYNEEEKKYLQLDTKAIHILCCAMNKEAFKKYSKCQTAKQIWDELEREMEVVNSPSPQVSNSSNIYAPDLYFLHDTRDAMHDFHRLCVPLHKHALEGNWEAAENILNNDHRLKHAAIASSWGTLLHVAAGANYPHFVVKLLTKLDNPQHITLQDMKGNTAFCFAAASGNIEIVQLMINTHPNLDLPGIRGRDGHTPLQFAAMVRFLYQMTITTFRDEDWKNLFFTCIYAGDYDMALDKQKRQLAFARDSNEETALHILAQIQKPLDCCCHVPEHQIHGRKQYMYLQLVNELWNTILHHTFTESMTETIDEIISQPFQLLFDAAEVGNFGFLSELINARPGSIWEVDNKNQSIIHTAVFHRHASIFNLVHEIGSDKDIIATYLVEEKGTKNNTLLHLAAYLAPPDQLQLVSGAAFQMCHELLWFEEVKKIMPPSYIYFRNSHGFTAQELFTKEHRGLRKEAEEWMKRTAEFCIIVSTVIAAGVFSAAINIPGGIDDNTNKPNYLGKTSFLVFSISDAAAFISSAIATLIFLSIFVSRYAEADFRRSLPLMLISGLIMFFIFIVCMMVAFSSSFFITCTYGLKWVPFYILLCSSLPALLLIVLQYSLWWDIISLTFSWRTQF